MTKYKIVKESNALPEGWEVGCVVTGLKGSYMLFDGKNYLHKKGYIEREHFFALLELGVVEEVKESSGIDSVTLNGVEIQQNGIIRNSKGRLIGRLDGVEYESEHVQCG